MEEDSNPGGGNPEVAAAEPAPTVASSQPRKRKFSIRKLNERLSLIISLLLKCGGITLVILFASVMYRELSFKGYSLQEIRVPEQLAKDGHTGEAIAAGVEAELQKIKNKVENYDEWDINDGVEAGDYSVAENGDELEVNLVGVGFSLGSVVNLVRTSLGIEKNRTVRAYITLDHSNIRLTTYIKGHPPQEITIPMDSTSMGATVKKLSVAAAESILKVSNPELLATYLSTGNRTAADIDKIIEICKHALLNNPDPLRLKHFYTMLGWAQLDKRDVPAGMQTLDKALVIDPMFLSAYFGKAVGFVRMNKRSKARAVYRQALKVVEKKKLSEKQLFFYREMFYRNMMNSYWNSALQDSAMRAQNTYISFLSKVGGNRMASGYNEIAFRYSERGSYDSALVNIKKAIVLDSSLAIAYTTLAEIYGYQKNKDLFYYYMAKSFDKGFVVVEGNENDPPYSWYKHEKRFREIWPLTLPPQKQSSRRTGN
jgi:tetratricopeptide (TPR) repeat protein